MKKVFIYPSINIDALKEDPDLEISNNIILLKREKDSSLSIINSYDVIDEAEIPGSMAILKHLAEKFNYLFIASDMLYGKGAEFAENILRNIGGDASNSVMAFIDFATLEMLNFSGEYGWSKSFYNRLTKLRNQNRAEMDVKTEYIVGESVRFDYCGPDATSLMNGRVIFTDKHHAIVQVPCSTYHLAADFNRNTMPIEQVESILGRPISEIRENEFDCFVDMYNSLTFITKEIF
ncbi:MAG: hypothetical protein II214_04880 [Alistipes sp.]|nr:hypothetical protein [Alistipes sp.]